MIRKKTYKHKKEYYFIVNNKNDFQLESKQKLPVNDKMLQIINKKFCGICFKSTFKIDHHDVTDKSQRFLILRLEL